MNQASENNRIVKNTFFMYFRMILVLIVSLYTSRVVLHVLGVDDYGIYNVVGGVVVLFTFINQAMATATQRYFSYELGKKESGDISKIFSITLRIHLGIAGIILLLAETAGLWFVNTQMNFPDGTMTAVNWVYQFSIAACLFNIIRVPYNGLVISYERMSFYAVNSIVESFLKLGIVFLLIISPLSKLIVYSALTLFVTVIISVWYIVFCRINFKDVRYQAENYSKETSEIIKFSTWATFGSVANIGYQQGINIILNIIYGVAVNAAVALATQINAAVTQFVGGFQQALNPQLIKSESTHDKDRQESLIFKSAKFSFFIMLLFSVPVVANMKYILTLWLGEYPDQTIIFCQLIMSGALIECLSGPLWVTIFATGKIRTYQITISALLLLNLPTSYIMCALGYPASTVFVIRMIIFIIALITRLLFLKRLVGLNILKFSIRVIKPIVLVLIIIAAAVYPIRSFMTGAENISALSYQTFFLIMISGLAIYAVGLDANERHFIQSMVSTKIHLK